MIGELIHRVKPDLIIETGTAAGGTALFFRDMARMVNPAAEVVTIDLDYNGMAHEDGIAQIVGSSVDPDIVRAVSAMAQSKRVLVDLDSDHKMPHVLAELEAYAPLVSAGSYLIVEDTNINGNPVFPDCGPGPAEALAAFLPRHPEFSPDLDCEKFGVTFFPGGWLRRRSDA